jgi:hypothetical protein
LTFEAIALCDMPEVSACRRLTTPAWKRAALLGPGGISLLMPPSMPPGTDNPGFHDHERKARV